MMRPSVQGVDPPVCCTWMTYARDSFVDSPSGAFCPLEGGAQTHWHQSYTVLSEFKRRKLLVILLHF